VGEKAEKGIGHLLVGVAALLFISDLIVKVAGNLAKALSLPLFVIGLVLLAVGTTLPEVIVSFKSVSKHADGIFFGNLLGSIIVNSTLAAGIVAVINPLEAGGNLKFWVPGAVFVTASVLFWFFIKTKHFLSRGEAIFLLVLYLVFVILELG